MRGEDAVSVAPVRESQDQAVQVARLQAELAAARAEVESLQTLLKEQAVRSRRIEESRQAWAQTVDALAQPMFMHDNKGCIVRANRAYAERAGVPQERTGLPSRCTVHAPQSCAPQPNLVPVMPTVSRMAQSSGVLGSTSTSWVLPLMFRRAMLSSQKVAGPCLKPGCGYYAPLIP